jgi:hypothetical protein
MTIPEPVRLWWQAASLPLRVLAVAIPLAVAGLGIYGTAVWLGYATDHVSWRWSDRKDAASEARVADLEADNAALRKQSDDARAEVSRLAGERDALKKALGELGADERKIDAKLEDDRARLEAARAGGAAADPDPDALLDELRAAYPKHRR